MTDSYLRRTVLALTGSVLAGSTVASADHEHEQKQKQKHGDDTCRDCTHDCMGPCKRSYITATNRVCSQRKVFVSTTETSFDLQIPSGETKTASFAGDVQRLEVETGDVDVCIEQRTQHTLERSACKKTKSDHKKDGH